MYVVEKIGSFWENQCLLNFLSTVFKVRISRVSNIKKKLDPSFKWFHIVDNDCCDNIKTVRLMHRDSVLIPDTRAFFGVKIKKNFVKYILYKVRVWIFTDPWQYSVRVSSACLINSTLFLLMYSPKSPKTPVVEPQIQSKNRNVSETRS